MIEEYMTGREVSVETFVADGIAHVLQITDKQTSGAPHFVETGHSQPTALPQKTQLEIAELADAACRAVGLDNGPAHIEMMVTDKGPKMIEMGARMGGDCITSHLVPLSTGIDMTRQTILWSLGFPLDLGRKTDKAAAIRFFAADSGVITAIEGVEKAKDVQNIKEIGFFKKVGDEAGTVNASGDRTGYAIAQADTVEDAFAACDRAIAEIKFTVEKGN